MSQQKSFAFSKFSILKDQCLGGGSYGSVYRVKCDNLLCAGKIIHPVLVSIQPEFETVIERPHGHPMSRFETECDFLKDLRHPNIIQFLGMTTDPQTGHPVLIMELMDENLTHFLENAPTSIPYHIQVSICLDVIKALSFLHSNKIVHRDLSSNNILLLANAARAKLTDFGMAKLKNSVDLRSVSNTLCPGTNVYMPPEAVEYPAVYTDKGDVFSFGVNIIQMLTRKFPNPQERQHVNQLGFSAEGAQVPEIDRRNNHISEVDSTHPLLSIALDCLNDDESKRPSAGQLCSRVASLKDAERFNESEAEQRIQSAKAVLQHDQQANIAEIELQQELDAIKVENETLKADLQQQVDEKQGVTEGRDKAQLELTACLAENRALKSDLQEKTNEKQRATEHRDKLRHNLTIIQAENQALKESLQQEVAKKQRVTEAQEKLQSELTATQAENEALKSDLLKQINEKQGVIEDRDKLQCELTGIRTENQALKSGLQKQANEKQGVIEERDKLQCELTGIRTENQALKSDMQKQANEKQGVIEDHNKLQHEHTDIQAENQALKADLQKQVNEKLGVTENRDKLQSELIAIRAENQALKMDLQKQANENQRVTEAHDNLHSDLEALRVETQTLITDMEQEVRKQQTAIIADRDKLHRDLTAIHVENETLKKDLQQQVTKKEQISKDRDTLQHELAAFRVENQTLRTDMQQEVQGQQRAIIAERDKLQQELTAISAENQTLKADLKQLEQKHTTDRENFQHELAATKRKCRTLNCEFFGSQETRFFCSQCFERDMEKILQEVDNMMAPKRQESSESNADVQEPRPSASVQPPEPPKCPTCEHFFANEEYGGICSSCFFAKTKEDST